MSSIKKNFSYNIIYQLLMLLIPLITAPYISRILGVDGIGIYSYTYSVANYFVLFAMLGINNYGNRCIAKNKINKENLDKEFSAIYTLQILMSIITTFIYFLYVVFFEESIYRVYSFAQLIFVVSSIFDINWLFFGLEKFKISIIRNIVIKIISFISIFIFVKTKSDLIIYILILAFTTLISNLSLWILFKKYIIFKRVEWKCVKKHIKPILILFIPVIAISIYNIMDKIMLGNLSSASQLGLYENSERIINIPISLIAALGTVMMPRISNLIALNKKEEVGKYIENSMKFIMFIAIPITFGIIAISEDFAPIFYGEEFSQAGVLIKLLSITIIFKAWANVIRTQYLLPLEKDKFYVISVLLGALINLILNIILIPKLEALGAVIGTIMAEFIVCFYQTYVIRKELNIKLYMKSSIYFIITSLTMYLIISINKVFIENKYLLIVVQVIMGMIIYFGLNYKYILKTIFKRKKNYINGGV